MSVAQAYSLNLSESQVPDANQCVSSIILHKFPGSDLRSMWRSYLSRLECPAHYDSPAFFLEPFWTGKRPFAILAIDGDRITGVLTGIHDGKHVLSGLPSRPQISVDPGSDQHAVLEALMQGLLREAESAETISVYTWSSLELDVFAAQGFRRRLLAGNVVLDLAEGAEGLFLQFAKDRRRNVRFAEKHGIEISEATTPEDVAEAYEVYRQWRRTDRKQILSEERSFEVFAGAVQLTDNKRLFLARLSGKVIAVNSFRYHPNGLFESAANYSLEDFLHLKPNDLLQWKGIEWACRHGFRRHSLGGSHEFLRRFGGTVVTILRYRLDRSLLRQHHLAETVCDLGRATLRSLPISVEHRVRYLLKGVGLRNGVIQQKVMRSARA